MLIYDACTNSCYNQYKNKSSEEIIKVASSVLIVLLNTLFGSARSKVVNDTVAKVAVKQRPYKSNCLQSFLYWSDYEA